VSKLYSNDGTGNFDLITGSPFFAARYGSSVFADIDGDNDKDVLITGLNNSIYHTGLYTNDGTGKFTIKTGTPFDSVNQSSIAFSDIDGDLDQDVLITGGNNLNDRVTKLYLNDGVGNYSYVVGTSFDSVHRGSVAFSDIDGDLDQDVLITGRNNLNEPVAKLYINDGVGNFVIDNTTPFDQVYESSVAFADIDNDGDQDVLISGFNTGLASVSKLYVNDGLGNFVIDTSTPFDGVYSGSVAFSDVDNDGDQDLLITGVNSSNQRISKLYLNDGTGTFTLIAGTPFEGVDKSAIHFSDVDSDGDPDLLITGRNSSSESVSKLYSNDGNGNFTVVNGVSFDGVQEGSLDFSDIDGDGDEDLVLTGLRAVKYISKLYRNNSCIASFGTDTQVACDSYGWIDGNTYTSSNNTATFMLTNSLGCDSVVTLDLTINNSSTGTDTQVACDSYDWIDGNTYTSSNNTATFTLTNSLGCDSVVTLDLTLNNSNTGTDTQIACDSYDWIDGNTYTSSNNTATFTLTNSSGCDSVVTLDLTLNNSSTGIDTQTACDSYDWIDGNTYTSSNNTATFTLTNSLGCDSVVTLDLTLNNSNTGTDTQIACDSYDWIDGNTYTSSNNTATFTLTNSSGCDSVVTLDLTLNNSSTGIDTQTACDSYDWIDGNTYTSSNNTATFTLTNSLGCDSVVTLDLTLNNSSTGTDTQTACDSYDWIDGNTYTSSNNTATFTLTNSLGCDSLVTLDLTLNNSSTGIDTQTACDSYDWIDGNTYTSSNNTATFTLTNSLGCDSVVTLDLTLNNSSTGTDTQIACDSYDWIDGNTYTSSNNTATFTLTNSSGCDSVVTLDLTLNNSSTGIDTQVACDSYDWIDGNTYTSSNNTATFTLTNSLGCDSVVTLDLTINDVVISVTNDSGVLLANSSTGLTYQWLDCLDNSSEIVGETSSSFTPVSNGEYSVEVTDGNCIDTSLCVVFQSLSIQESMSNEVIVYPNPSSGIFKIDSELEILKVQIIDIQGKEVFNASTNNINIENENKGIYMVKVFTDRKIFIQKIIKE
jgi:hypothetical protein